MIVSRPSIFKKSCAAALCASLALQPLVGYAVPITASALSEIPLQALNPVRPNIMYTLDDSGSMNDLYLPDYVGEQVPSPAGVSLLFCLGTDTQARDCGQAPNGHQWNGGNLSIYDVPVRASAFNRIYYDPTINYTAGKRSDGTDLAYEAASPGTWTQVYTDPYQGYPGTNFSATTNLVTSFPDTLWCTTSSPTQAQIDGADVALDGSVCRRNGRAYTGPNPVAAGYNYPNTKSSGTQYVNPVNVAGAPYYYTLSKIQFCASQDTSSTANGGFGTGACTNNWNVTTSPFVRYGTDAANAFDPTAFTRVDIVPSVATFPSGRTYAQEMANFARWYAFYRTRLLAMKGAGGIAFSALDKDTARVGFHTLNSFGNNFLNVKEFSQPNKETWFTNHYSVIASGATPTPDAMWRVGEYFSNKPSGLPGATDPALPDPGAQNTGQCQPNFHLLATDGYWNFVLRNPIGDWDQTVPGSLPGAIPGFTPGAPFPRPFFEGTQTSSDNLADLAMSYWIRDLRPDLPDKVKDTVAPWQHVTFYGLSIGAQGNIVYPGGIGDITSGAKDWPTTVSGSPGQYLGATSGAEAIDDLWHAAINARGKYFNANNARELAEAIVSSLADFTDQSGTGTAVGIAGAQFSASKSFGYRTSYETGWWGDVKKYALDPSTGALPVDSSGNPANAPLWSAATQLDTQAAVTGWDTNRRILTINDATNTVVPFRASQLSAAQRSSLVAGWSIVGPLPSAQSVVNYLRGDPSNEGVGTTNFRVRAHILGDIAYSGAVPVGAPSQPYTDTGNPGYTAFASAQQSRTPMLYVGANDGMLHAFIDSTTTDAGKETWAYVPKAMFTGGDPNDTAHTPSASFQIGSLAYRRGGIPLFAHRFFVNATPRIWDIDFANTNTKHPPQSGNDWRTLLVGGLGAGGRSIYALDVTTPVALADSEALIASSGRVLWEFTDDNLGYVFDAPTLVKTYRYGWVALVVSGYNNPGGEGILYVLNPTDGKILKKLSTGVGSDADPSGLSTIRAFAPSRKDPYMLQAYGGDLKGNVWRFDLSDPNAAKWKVELIAKLTDAQGNAQPITTGVRIEIDQNNNIDRYIFVGTGKLLGKDDLADSSVGNTLYVIRDGTVTAPDPAPTTPYSRADLKTVNGSVVSGFTGAPTGRGWYQDGADKSQKIGTDVFADVQTVVYAFSKPSTDPCDRPLSSTLYARDLLTGNSVLVSEGGSVVSGIDIGAGIAGVALIQGQGGATGSVSSGDVRAQVTTMSGQVFSFGVKLAGAANLKHRVSWRLLNRD
jgi:type IV pilus assembly protein PilY1